jgi:hypothetical protein
MSEVAAIEVPADPVLPVLSPLGAAAELDAAPPNAPEAAASAGPAAERALPFEIEHAVGATRQAVLDHFLDSEGDQSMAQIKAALANMLPGTVEAAVRREYEAGRLLRVAPGTYRLAPPKPAELSNPAPSPEPEPVRGDEMTDEQWLDALERFFADPSSWNVEELGPGPTELTNRIPHAVKVRMNDRLRKKEERRRDAAVAAARRAEADAALRDQLLAVCRGNFQPNANLNDLAPVRAMLRDGVSVEHISIGLKRVTDKRIEPAAPPLLSWREPRFLESVARSVLLGGLLPKMVATWAAGGTVPQMAASASEASPAFPEPAPLESAPAPSPANGSAPSKGIG